MIPITCADLIGDVRDCARFEELYKMYYRQMYSAARQILRDEAEAEDAVQEALIGIARNMHTVGKIADARDVYYYMLRAAKNAAISLLRRKNVGPDLVDMEGTDALSDKDFWERLALQQDYEQLVQAISDLPEIYRDMLWRHYVLELTVPEIAAELQMKLPAAKQRLVRGRKLLFSRLEERGGLGDETDK